MHSAHSFFRRVIQPCLAALLLLNAMAFAENARKPLQLILYTPLNMDGSATTASTTLQLFNPNSVPVTYILGIQNAKAKNTGKDPDWVIAFYGTDNKPVGPLLDGTLAANKSIRIRVDISHAIEAGETTADLTNNNSKIADLKLVKEQGLPFKVSLEGNPTEKPEIEFVQGTPLDLRWKNDDPMHYPVSWEFLVKGKSVSGSSLAGPNGSTKFTVNPDGHWFSWWQSLFRSETVDGTVTLGYQPQSAPNAYPSKTLPVKVRLSYWNPASREVISIILVLIFLAAGAFFSSYVNVDLINRVRAISIKRKIGELARTIGEISPQLNSQLRVALWLERDRILASLPSGTFFTPETAATLTQSDADRVKLNNRVDSAAQVSEAIVRLNHAIEKGEIAPTLENKASKNLLSAQDLLKKSVLTAGESERIASLLGAATNILDDLGQPDDDLEKAIAARLQELTARFTSAFQGTATCIFIKRKAPIPFNLLTGGAKLGTQGERDANTRKLAAIADMVLMQSLEADILACLARQDFTSVQSAEQRIRELKEGISLKDLSDEITANPPRVYISVDRDTVRAKSPILMKLMFNKARYNQAAAKQRIECTWSFDHDNLTEKGWEVHHYFPKVREYHVKLTFKDINQIVIKPAQPIEHKVEVHAQLSEDNHTRVEIQRWLVGLLIAVVGLFAGAKDKILTMDTGNAILALFVIGFTIDTAKNFLAPKETSPKEASSRE